MRKIIALETVPISNAIDIAYLFPSKIVFYPNKLHRLRWSEAIGRNEGDKRALFYSGKVKLLRFHTARLIISLMAESVMACLSDG